MHLAEPRSSLGALSASGLLAESRECDARRPASKAVGHRREDMLNQRHPLRTFSPTYNHVTSMCSFTLAAMSSNALVLLLEGIAKTVDQPSSQVFAALRETNTACALPVELSRPTESHCLCLSFAPFG
jgi:hypothetical protein